MSIKSDLSFSQTTQNALQEAAALFRQNKVDDAYHVLHENISLPQIQGKLTKAQADIVYRSMIPDPLSAPETPFSKRSCIPAIALRGHALKDLLAQSNLPIGEERSAILKAAAILETEGDEEKAWKILDKALIPSGSNESLIKEVHRIMIDSLRTPTSTFLQKHVKEHPAMLEDNFLRASTLEGLSSHFFDKEVVEGSKIQLDSPILELRAKTRSALQLAAQLFKEGKKEEAQGLLKSAILIPYEKGELTKAQVDAVYKTLEDPYHPQTDFAKKQFHPLFVLRAQALKDLVSFYSELPIARAQSFPCWSPELDDRNARTAILKAASLIETHQDIEGAWKILNDGLSIALTNAKKEEYPQITEEIVNEVHRIMNDHLRTPTSAFLQKRIRENPSLTDENRLRARALESISIHIFDDEVIKGEAPQFKMFSGTERATLEKDLTHMALPYLGSKELASFSRTTKSSKETVVKSIQYREEVSWREFSDWQRMGITLNKEMLSSVRVIKSDGAQKVDAAELKYILSLCGEHVEVVDFGPKKIEEEHLALIGKYCPNLLSFFVSESKYTMREKDLKPLALGCPKLQHLSLKNCRLSPEALAPFKQCPDLRSIDISGNKDLKDSDIETLVLGCKNLTDFTAEGISLGDRTLRALAQCPLLKSLKLSDCWSSGVLRGNFSVGGMQALVDGCRALTELSLSACSIKNEVLCVIGEARLPLTKINISFNNSWEDAQNGTPIGILSLLKGNPQVRELTLFGNHLKDDALETIAEHCPLVTKLVISNNREITPKGLRAVAKKCTHLTHLEMEGFRQKIRGYLEALTDSACQLTSIDFDSNGCTYTTEVIDFVKKHTGLKHIQLPIDLITDDEVVTDDVLVAIAENCHLLESLECYGDGISAKGIAALGRGCPHFKRLIAKNRGNTGDEFLKAIGENLPELTHLDITNGRSFKGISSYNKIYLFNREGFIALGKGCSKLADLNLTYCMIDPILLETIIAACPSLARIDVSRTSVYDVETLLNKRPGMSIRYTDRHSREDQDVEIYTGGEMQIL